MVSNAMLRLSLLVSISAHAASLRSSSLHRDHVSISAHPVFLGSSSLHRDDAVGVHRNQTPTLDPKAQQDLEYLEQRYKQALKNNFFARAKEFKEIEEEVRFEAMTDEQKVRTIRELQTLREKAKAENDLDKALEITNTIARYQPSDDLSDKVSFNVGVAERRFIFWAAMWFFDLGPTFKFMIAALMIMPVMQPMVLWQLNGHPPHPFLLARDAVHDPRMCIKIRKYQADLMGICALVGMDIMFYGLLQLAGWDDAMKIIRVLVLGWFGVAGFATGMHAITRHTAPEPHPGTHPEHGVDVQDDEYRADVVEVRTMYQDPRIGAAQIFITFVVQCSLLVFFWRYVAVGSGDLTVKECKYWTFAIPFQIMSRDMLGLSWHHEIHVWRKFMNCNNVLRTQPGTGKQKRFKIKHRQILVRAAFSYIANNLVMGSVIFCLPMFLMKAATAIDFVKDCFAVVFISTLDDLNSPVDLKFVGAKIDDDYYGDYYGYSMESTIAAR